MYRFLLKLSISRKIFELHNEVWFKHLISLESLLVTLELFNLILGLILRFLFNVTDAIFLCATLPNIFLTIVLTINQYKLDKTLSNSRKIRDELGNELFLLENYDNFSDDEMYQELLKLSDFKIPKIRKETETND